jgi:5-(carboxyamino)imidazole ribonucleotide synthase
VYWAVDRWRAVGDKLRPRPRSLAVAQDRAVEKQFIEGTGARVAPWRAVDNLEGVQSAVREFGTPLVLKTRRYGYDGKGQAWIRSPDDTEAAWNSIRQEPAVAEAGVDFAAEFSVMVARWEDGSTTFWDSPDNVHREGILRTSRVPSGDPIAPQVEEARRATAGIAEALGHIGVLTVEFFASRDGPLVNEIAPRVHNSGHWTIEGAFTSQFEQHIRAICGLPPGSTELACASAKMDNLIGGEVLDWKRLLADPHAHVHIYGKGEARSGRKMGHVTRIDLE